MKLIHLSCSVLTSSISTRDVKFRFFPNSNFVFLNSNFIRSSFRPMVELRYLVMALANFTKVSPTTVKGDFSQLLFRE